MSLTGQSSHLISVQLSMFHFAEEAECKQALFIDTAQWLQSASQQKEHTVTCAPRFGAHFNHTVPNQI